MLIKGKQTQKEKIEETITKYCLRDYHRHGIIKAMHI